MVGSASVSVRSHHSYRYICLHWTFLTFKSGNVQGYVAFSGCLATIASLVKLAGNAYKTIKMQVAEVATEVELRLTVQLEKEGAAIRKELSETEARILEAIAGSKP
ncbi:hypothetical protein NADE_009255 [Nannochloris sp. 'desiccata']|nr:hypothetical protein NADE_009255 [Chlorella desiccata (nom. nud.)]